MVALRRGLDESQTLARELDRVRVDRSNLEAALVTRALGEAASQDNTEAAASPERLVSTARLLRPVRGTPVAVPGARRDGTTLHASTSPCMPSRPVRSNASSPWPRVGLL